MAAAAVFTGRGAPAPPAVERYRGRVIDAETRQPLGGAGVTVIWMKPPFLAIDAVSSFHAAREAVTAADGTFAVDGKPAANWNPFWPLNQQRRQLGLAPD